MPIQKITPFLWFDNQAEEAAGFYVSIFSNSKIVKVVRYGEAAPDKFGLSWQVVPAVLPELLCNPDPEKSQRVMKAMLTMKKLDIRGLKQALDNP
jgi:predicted 3-demethylubiquinone-9 3-methyltransferase (glyoxalase superfamily)